LGRIVERCLPSMSMSMCVPHHVTLCDTPPCSRRSPRDAACPATRREGRGSRTALFGGLNALQCPCPCVPHHVTLCDAPPCSRRSPRDAACPATRCEGRGSRTALFGGLNALQCPCPCVPHHVTLCDTPPCSRRSPRDAACPATRREGRGSRTALSQHDRMSNLRSGDKLGNDDDVMTSYITQL